MKFCLLKVIIFIFYFHNILTVKLKNPDEVLADSNGGNNGEFMRRNQLIEIERKLKSLTGGVIY